MVTFEVRKDANAPVTRQYILSVKRDGVCLEAPRFQSADEALQKIPGYMYELCVKETTIEVKV